MISLSFPIAGSLGWIAWRLSREDLRMRSVHFYDLVLYGLITIIVGHITWVTVALGSLIFVTMLIAQGMLGKVLLGEADQFLLFTVPFYVSIQDLPQFFVVCGSSILIFRLFVLEERMPFVPLFFISLLIVFSQKAIVTLF